MNIFSNGRKAQHIFVALFAYALSLQACAGGGSSDVNLLPQPQHSSSAQSATATIALSRAGGTQTLPSLNGISTSMTLPANTAQSGTSLSVTISTTAPAGMPTIPASFPTTFLYYALTASEDATLYAAPQFAITLPSRPQTQGQLYAWAYSSTDRWMDLGTVTLRGSTLVFGGATKSVTLHKGIQLFIAAFTAKPNARCPTPTPSPSPSPTASFNPQYRLIQLPPNFRGNHLNDNGMVAGDYSPSGATGPVVAAFYQRGEIHVIGTLPGYEQGTAQGINDANQIVGWAFQGGKPTRAFLFSGGRILDLHAPPDFSTAWAINNNGVVAGTFGTDVDQPQALLYDAGTCAPFLFPFTATKYRSSWAFSINDSGQYVGTYILRGVGTLEAYVGSGDLILPLGFEGTAADINAQGDVVGDKGATVGGTHTVQPFLRDHTTGAVITLGFPGDDTGRGFAINDADQVVGLTGRLHGSGLGGPGFIYQNGRIASLPSDVVPLDINNKGEILVQLFSSASQAGILEPLSP